MSEAEGARRPLFEFSALISGRQKVRTPKKKRKTAFVSVFLLFFGFFFLLDEPLPICRSSGPQSAPTSRSTTIKSFFFFIFCVCPLFFSRFPSRLLPSFAAYTSPSWVLRLHFFSPSGLLLLRQKVLSFPMIEKKNLKKTR